MITNRAEGKVFSIHGRVLVAAAPLLLVALASVTLGAGCEKVSVETIDKWKGTVKGPDKLQDAFTDGGLDPDLRARAAIALQSLGRGEFVASALKSMSAGDRTPVVSALVRLQAATVKNGEGNVQDARDGLFLVREYATGADRDTADEALMLAIENQMTSAGKMGGSQSLAKIVEALGPKASPLLVKLMAMPKAPHAEVAELLAKVGDAAAKSQAGDAYLPVAKKAGNAEPGSWQALGLLASPAVVAYLKHQVDEAPWQQGQQAARALTLQPHPELGEFALVRAANPKLHGNVREEMFTLAATCCGAATVPGLAKLMQTSADPMVKYRAFSAVLQAAGAGGVDAGLDGLDKVAVKPEDADDFLVKEIAKLGAPAREASLKLLSAPAPLKRMVAVMCLAKVGKPDDAQQLKALANDKATVKGFPAGQTVGREADRVASLLAKGG